MIKIIPSILFIFISLNSVWAQQPNDCENYIQVCGNQVISLDVSGPGAIEEVTGKGCTSGEHNSLWLRITVKTSGTLGFILTPGTTDIYEDYDFWVFGPNSDCQNLNYAIRCSTTNPNAAGQNDNLTGLRDSETDTSEGPGMDGNSFVKSLDVLAGESYFIVLDRPIGNSNFNLEWTGTAELLNPLEKVEFTNTNTITITDQNNDGVELLDFSTLNNKFVNDQTGLTFSYYSEEADAFTQIDPHVDEIEIQQGKYFYRLENNDTNCFLIKEFSIKFLKEQLPKYSQESDIYNFISPNQDGFNDIFVLDNLEIYKGNTQFKIYDRYGKILFSEAGKDKYEWNGTLHGRAVPSDDYWYILTINGIDVEKGHITIKNK